MLIQLSANTARLQNDMKQATEGVGAGKKGDALAPKGAAVSDDAPVQLLSAFAAQHIEIDRTRGCHAAGKEKRKITSWTFDEVPARGVPFEVCLALASKAGREMQMTVAIVDMRNQRVARAEDVIDFRGKPRIDHVLAFPAPTFKSTGQHFYVVDLDGKEVGRLPLFVVAAEGGDGSVPALVPAASVDPAAGARPAAP